MRSFTFLACGMLAAGISASAVAAPPGCGDRYAPPQGCGTRPCAPPPCQPPPCYYPPPAPCPPPYPPEERVPYQRPEPSGRFVGESNSVGVRGLGIRFPELDLRLPTIELPSLFQSRTNPEFVTGPMSAVATELPPVNAAMLSDGR